MGGDSVSAYYDSLEEKEERERVKKAFILSANVNNVKFLRLMERLRDERRNMHLTLYEHDLLTDLCNMYFMGRKG